MKEVKFNEIGNQIMTEITEFCMNECGSRECCPEDECVLFRIEKIIENASSSVKKGKHYDESA